MTKSIHLTDIPIHSLITQWSEFLSLYATTNTSAGNAWRNDSVRGLSIMLSERKRVAQALTLDNFEQYKKNLNQAKTQADFLSPSASIQPALAESAKDSARLQTNQSDLHSTEQTDLITASTSATTYFDFACLTKQLTPLSGFVSLPKAEETDTDDIQRYLQTSEQLIPTAEAIYNATQSVAFGLRMGQSLKLPTFSTQTIYEDIVQGLEEYTHRKGDGVYLSQQGRTDYTDGLDFICVRQHAYKALGQAQALEDLIEITKNSPYFNALRQYQIEKETRALESATTAYRQAQEQYTPGSAEMATAEKQYAVAQEHYENNVSLWREKSYDEIILHARQVGLMEEADTHSFHFKYTHPSLDKLAIPALQRLKNAESEYRYLVDLQTEFYQQLQQNPNLLQSLSKIKITAPTVSLNWNISHQALSQIQNGEAVFKAVTTQMVQPYGFARSSTDLIERGALFLPETVALMQTRGAALPVIVATESWLEQNKTYQNAKYETTRFLSETSALQWLTEAMNESEHQKTADILLRNEMASSQIKKSFPDDADFAAAVDYGVVYGDNVTREILSVIKKIRQYPLQTWEEKLKEQTNAYEQETKRLEKIQQQLQHYSESDGTAYQTLLNQRDTLAKEIHQAQQDADSFLAEPDNAERLDEYITLQNNLNQKQAELQVITDKIQKTEQENPAWVALLQEQTQTQARINDLSAEKAQSELAVQCLQNNCYFKNVISYLSRQNDSAISDMTAFAKLYPEKEQEQLHALADSLQQLTDYTAELHYREQLVCAYQNSTRPQELLLQPNEQIQSPTQTGTDSQITAQAETNAQIFTQTNTKAHPDLQIPTQTGRQLFTNINAGTDFLFAPSTDNQSLTDEWEYRIRRYYSEKEGDTLPRAWRHADIAGLREELTARTEVATLLTADNFDDYKQRLSADLRQSISTATDIQARTKAEATRNRLLRAKDYTSFATAQGDYHVAKETIILPNDDNKEQVSYATALFAPAQHQRYEMIQSLAYALQTGQRIKTDSSQAKYQEIQTLIQQGVQYYGAHQDDYAGEDYRAGLWYQHVSRYGHRAVGYAETYQEAIETILSSPNGKLLQAYAIGKLHQSEEALRQDIERARKQYGADTRAYQQAEEQVKVKQAHLFDQQKETRACWDNLTTLKPVQTNLSASESLAQLKSLENNYFYLAELYNEFIEEYTNHPQAVRALLAEQQQLIQPNFERIYSLNNRFNPHNERYRLGQAGNQEESYQVAEADIKKRIQDETNLGNRLILNLAELRNNQTEQQQFQEALAHVASTATTLQTKEILSIVMQATRLSAISKEDLANKRRENAKRYKESAQRFKRKEITKQEFEQAKKNFQRENAVLNGAETGNYFYHALRYATHDTGSSAHRELSYHYRQDMACLREAGVWNAGSAVPQMNQKEIQHLQTQCTQNYELLFELASATERTRQLQTELQCRTLLLDYQSLLLQQGFQRQANQSQTISNGGHIPFVSENTDSRLQAYPSETHSNTYTKAHTESAETSPVQGINDKMRQFGQPYAEVLPDDKAFITQKATDKTNENR